mgnify:CR=1 FL=1
MVEEAMNESLPCPLFLAQTPLTSIDQMAWCLGEKRPAPPEVIRGRGHTVSQRGQLRRRPESAKLYHFQPIQWPPVYIAPESVLR